MKETPNLWIDVTNAMAIVAVMIIIACLASMLL